MTETETETKPNAPSHTKQCQACGATMDIIRGVCPKCGHMTPWFKFRLYFGCGMILLAFLGLGVMLYLALSGG